MRNFEFIPAIDVLGGRCVQLAQGRYDRATVFDDDPAASDTADLLGRNGHRAATDALRALLDDPNPDVAEIASEALEEIEARGAE